jgi:hypothetical protein
MVALEQVVLQLFRVSLVRCHSTSAPCSFVVVVLLLFVSVLVSSLASWVKLKVYHATRAGAFIKRVRKVAKNNY